MAKIGEFTGLSKTCKKSSVSTVTSVMNNYRNDQIIIKFNVSPAVNKDIGHVSLIFHMPIIRTYQLVIISVIDSVL